MKQNRRELLKFASWLMAMPLFSVANARPLSAAPKSEDEAQLQEAAIDFFVKLGYRRLPAMHLITGEGFNDGLRFDDTPDQYPPGKTVRLQDCARMEDLARRGEPGVLPYFHIVALSSEKPTFRGELLTQVLDYLLQSAELDPKRFVFVSTDRFTPYLVQLQPYDISREQFVQRDLDAAIAAGDGSGYFRPKGHPAATGEYTVSIHYALDAGAKAPGKALAYPLNGYLELAEVGIDSERGKSVPAESGGFGLERVLMAQGKPIDSFAQSHQKALAAIRAESERRGIALPKGYQKIRDA